LYALGITMFEMLAGRLPFEGDLHHVMARKAIEDPPRLIELGIDVPPALAAIVDRLLARDPAARFQSAGDVIAALDRPDPSRVRAPAAFAPTVSLTTGPTPPARSRRPVALAAVAVALAAGGVATWRLMPDPPVAAATAPAPAPAAPAPAPAALAPVPPPVEA